MRIHPFPALLPAPDLAEQIASPPYDVVNRSEARAIAEGNPLSFLHIVRSEIDLPDSVDAYDPRVYDLASATLARFVSDGTLRRDPAASIYLYRQVIADHEQIGVVACLHVDDYENDLIKKHERTRPDKEDDRTRHVLELNAHAEPVLLTYRDTPEIDVLVQQDLASAPLFSFPTPDGVHHTVWRVADPAAYRAAFSAVPAIYVADGHHRTACAWRAGLARRADNPHHDGTEEYNWFPSVLFPASHLQILAYNRLVRDLNGLSPAEFVARLSQVGRVTPVADFTTPRPGTFSVYLAGQWYLVEIDMAFVDQGDPLAALDVTLVQERLLRPILGIADQRTDKRIDFVGGIRGPEELVQRVDSGEMAVAISSHPTSIDQLLRVADAGVMMPPKSTWFEPKLRSGLFVHTLD